MKRILLMAVSILLAGVITAQTTRKTEPVKNDVILKVNGDELNGKITEIGDSSIKFIYSGETLVYNIKKSDIQKITFASGRVETFSKPPAPAEEKNEVAAVKKDPSETHNKVAILPFGYIADNQDAGGEIGYRVQTECFTFLNSHSGQYTILDPRTTNTMLIKAGITSDKMRGYTMDEICDILGVEYVIDATITQNRTSVSSSGSESYNATTKQTDAKTGKQKTSISGSSSASTQQNYETILTLNVYNNKNANIYSQNRKSFWTTGDAYRASLQYVLKRCPFYQK